MKALPEDTVEALARTTLLVQRDIYPAVSDLTIATAFASTPVVLTATAETLATVNGQTAVVTSAILASQLGVQLQLGFDEVALIGTQPPLRGEGLRESLLDLTSDLITAAHVGVDGDFNMAIGASPSGPGIGLSGDDWGFQLVTDGTTGAFRGEFPFGAGLGAVAASAEVFRHVMVRLSNQSGAEPLREHPVRGPLPASYSLMPFSWRPLDLGRVDSISAGALATSALYLLLRVPGLAMQLRLIDADVGALTNLNRYLLLRRALLNVPKVSALATHATDTIKIEPVPLRFDENSKGEILPLADRVLVGVDDIPSRWSAQAHAPDWLGVAATSHFEVVISEHVPGSPCVGCLHAHDDPGPAEEIPTVSFVSAMSGFLLAHRLLRAGIGGGAIPSQTLAYPFNLAGEVPVWELPLSARADCPVGCALSQDLVANSRTSS
jgi:hypothetical protein